jgi:hypothetical protein
MTGNVRQGLGLLAAALVAVLLALLAGGTEVGEIAWLGAILLGFVGLIRIATGLLKPERD